MVELIAFIAVSAVALTFFSDMTSYTMKAVRAGGRRNRVHTADPEHSH